MATIKVLPVVTEHIGLVHPVDGPLAAEGSLWTLDAFTTRRLDDGTIRRFEIGVDDAKGGKATKRPAASDPAAPDGAAKP